MNCSPVFVQNQLDPVPCVIWFANAAVFDTARISLMLWNCKTRRTRCSCLDPRLPEILCLDWHDVDRFLTDRSSRLQSRVYLVLRRSMHGPSSSTELRELGRGKHRTCQGTHVKTMYACQPLLKCVQSWRQPMEPESGTWNSGVRARESAIYSFEGRRVCGPTADADWPTIGLGLNFIFCFSLAGIQGGDTQGGLPLPSFSWFFHMKRNEDSPGIPVWSACRGHPSLFISGVHFVFVGQRKNVVGKKDVTF